MSSKPITTLGNLPGVSGIQIYPDVRNWKDFSNLKEVKGKLDISYSRVESVDGVEYGSIWYDSEYENKELVRKNTQQLTKMETVERKVLLTT